MLSSLTRLTFFELKAAATRNRSLLQRTSWQHVTIDVNALALADTLSALPVLDGAVRGEAAVEVAAPPPVQELLADHLRTRGHAIQSGDSDLVLTLVPDETTPLVESGPQRTTVTLGRSFNDADERQSSHLPWIRAALVAGLTPAETLPRLRFSSRSARRGRRWLRRQVGVLTPPIVAVAMSSGASTDTLRELEERAGITAVPFCGTGGPPAIALAGCALCVGDHPDWTALAASLGVPTIRLNPHADADTPRTRPGVELWHWGRPSRAFEVVQQKFEFSHDANPHNIAVLGEHLAALRWPSDRVFRLLP